MKKRRRQTAKRWIRRGAVLLLVLAGLRLADLAGLFGWAGSDLSRYDGKRFDVAANVDGDTLDVELPDRRRGTPTTRVRLWGVDTPETKRPDTPVQHFGPESSAFTTQHTAGKQVRLRLTQRRTRDSYERLLAYVILPDGRMLNRLLVAEGYAYADTRFNHPYHHEFLSAMTRARRQGLGLWAGVDPADLPAYLRADSASARQPAACRPAGPDGSSVKLP